MSMEGSLLAPPDRGSIIGRATWKSRYVRLSKTSSTSKTPNVFPPQVEKGSKSRMSLKAASKSNLNEAPVSTSDDTPLYLSVYKTKGDLDSLIQYPILAFQSCQVRNIQYRKQTPPLPTLILEFKNDAMTANLRKRRSSRAGRLTSKDPWSNSLLFRPIEDESHSIYDWETKIKPLIVPNSENLDSVLQNSVINFTNPFVGRSASLVSAKKPDLQIRSWNQSRTSFSLTPSLKSSEIVSRTPSLRSRRSDVSSQASSQLHVPGFTASTTQATTFPSDLPSPCSNIGGDNKFPKTPLSTSTNLPITPRETILDRAFQMCFIPGSEGVLQSEDVDKLSSTAKFEALMREHERRKTEVIICKDKRRIDSLKEKEIDTATSYSEDIRGQTKDDICLSEQVKELSAPALRALNFIQGRATTTHQPVSSPPKSPALRTNPQTLSMLSGHDQPAADNTGTRPRIGATTRMNTSRSVSLNFSTRSISSSTAAKECSSSSSSGLTNAKIDALDTRQSNSSIKRLSFQEFARRLSSTSSLLISQTNASPGSTTASGDYGTDLTVNPPSYPHRDEIAQRCGWRGSVGALGVESNFL